MPLPSTAPLRRVRPGEPVRAREYNALVDAVNALAQAAAQTRSRRSRARPAPATGGAIRLGLITSVSVDPDEPALPSAVTYGVTVSGVGTELTDVTPEYGRPVRGDEARIYAAKEGDHCLLLLAPKPGGEGDYEHLMVVLSETVRRRAC